MVCRLVWLAKGYALPDVWLAMSSKNVREKPVSWPVLYKMPYTWMGSGPFELKLYVCVGGDAYNKQGGHDIAMVNANRLVIMQLIFSRQEICNTM